MELSDFNELHYITHISNVPSIMANGILSHNHAEKISHKSVAMAAVQKIRREKIVGGNPLHDYVNLYFHARNPMLYKRKELHAELCILRIDKEVLSLQDVVIADRNASSNSAKFASSPSGLSNLDKSLIFATFWTNSNSNIEDYKTSIKCAEVLVPNKVDVCYIMGAYVSCSNTNHELKKYAPDLDVVTYPYIFFRERG